jgi:hypothetical protein
MGQAAWGLFKKVVIADNCGSFADEIFDNYRFLPGSSLALGAFFYTIQLYADFSGYSDMAMGISRLLGFNVTRNFDYPLFARNIAEFWRKWHMVAHELGHRICLYAACHPPARPPQGGSHPRGGHQLRADRVVARGELDVRPLRRDPWVAVHPADPAGTAARMKPIPPGQLLPGARDAVGMALTFLLVALSIIVFRSPTLGDAVAYYEGLVSPTLFAAPEVTRKGLAGFAIALAVLMLAVEWVTRDKPHPAYRLGYSWPAPLRWSFYYAAFMFVFFFAGSGQNFIYVQF